MLVPSTAAAPTRIPIDPTLVDHAPPTKKRKTGARVSNGPTANANKVSSSPDAPSGSRVTRRSAAAASATTSTSTSTNPNPALNVATSAGDVLAGHVPNEPARGEEANLNEYKGIGGSTTKRPRTRPSPRKRTTTTTTTAARTDEARFYPDQPSWSVIGGRADAGPSDAAASSTESALEGIEELAAAAVAANDKPYHHPYSDYTIYPIGLTPFVYPCHIPDHPPPPPGDPTNPHFRRFDPHASGSTARRASQPSESSSTHSSASGSGSAPKPRDGPATLADVSYDPGLPTSARQPTNAPHNPGGCNVPQGAGAGIGVISTSGVGAGAGAAPEPRDGAGASNQGHRGTASGTNAEAEAKADAETEASSNAAYESISALLSASQGEFGFMALPGGSS